ncbi:MAG TPA: hypothetical protein VG796_09645 [Verrucomicrobiales bacterium]|nr:hypothetical protein [Verrucomicrobiales bacterium]
METACGFLFESGVFQHPMNFILCFRTRGAWALHCLLLLLTVLPSFSQTEKKLVWKNNDGKEITASFVKLEDGKVHLRTPAGTLAEVPLTSLSWESGRQAIALKWQLLGMADLRLAVPDRAGVSESFVKLTRVPEAEAAPKGWFRYRCANFEFDSQTELDSKFVAQSGRLFEATRELLKRLPWRIEAIPEKGSRFRALIYRDMKSYLEGGGPPGSAGVFKPSTGEFSLPLTSATDSPDTMQHEITHQMMQRLLPVIPWWIAEGTAEYVAIMKYRDGYYDCKMVSKKQVVPELQRRGPYCTDEAFLRALEYRSQTQAEMVLGSMLERTSQYQTHFRQSLEKEIAGLKAGFAKIEERRKLFENMFALEAGKSILLPPAETPPQPPKLAKVKSSVRMEHAITAVTTPGGIDQRNLYAGSTLMVYYLTSLAPDQGEGFARYMWAAQQLRDEFDLSMKLLEMDMAAYRRKIEELKTEASSIQRTLMDKAKEYDAYFDAALKYSNTCGYTHQRPDGRVEFFHKPDAQYKPPVPPESPVIKYPDLPSPPSPRLTAADVQKRQAALLRTLMNNSNPQDFLNDVKEAAAKLGVKCGR